MKQHYHFVMSAIMSMVLSVSIFANQGVAINAAQTAVQAEAPSKVFMPLVLNSLYPFVLLDKSIVKYSPPKSSDELYVFTGSIRNDSKRTLYGLQLNAKFYKQAQLVHTETITPLLVANFPGQVNYFRINITTTVATADRVDITLQAYADVSIYTYYPIEIVSSSPPPAAPSPSGLYNYIWVLRNSRSVGLVDVIAVADTNSGYVSSPIIDMHASEILTRTLTSYNRPYTALAAQGRINPVSQLDNDNGQ